VGSAHTRKLLKKFDQNFTKTAQMRGFTKFLVKLFPKSLRVWAEPTVLIFFIFCLFILFSF